MTDDELTPAEKDNQAEKNVALLTLKVGMIATPILLVLLSEQRTSMLAVLVAGAAIYFIGRKYVPPVSVMLDIFKRSQAVYRETLISERGYTERVKVKSSRHDHDTATREFMSKLDDI